MKIIITGATGFAGGAMVRHFSRKGHEIIALGRAKNPPQKLFEYARYVQADISQSVPKIECDVCIHCAALATDRAAYREYFETNFRGTERIFHSIHAQKFIQISTSSVYDFQSKIHFEDEPVNIDQLSNYGKTKRLAEDFLRKQKGGNRSIFILRPRAIYGVGDRVLLPRILNLVKNGKIKVPGDLEIDISLTHIENLIQAVEKCIESDFDFKIYNIADEEIYRLRSVVQALVETIFEKEIPIQSLNVAFLKNLARVLEFLKISTHLTPLSVASITNNNVLNIEKIQRELEYVPTQNFDNAIDEIKKWVRQIGIESVLKSESSLSWEI